MYATADDKLDAIRLAVAPAFISADEQIDRVRAILAEVHIIPAPKTGAANPVHCCLCLNISSARVPATTVLDGYSVCDEHHRDILDRAPYIVLYTDNRLALKETCAMANARFKGQPV